MSMRRICIYSVLLLTAPTGYAETRILPPAIGVSQSTLGPEAGVHRREIEALLELPIPVALPAALPFIRYSDATHTIQGEDSPRASFARDRRLSIGLLHHASEGAPLWKISTGLWSGSTKQWVPIGATSLNLEKIFPMLRPHNSDKLDSWVGFSLISPPRGKALVLPELGWVWKSAEGLLLDFAVPHRALIGWSEDSWTGSLGLRQKWFIHDSEASQSFFEILVDRYVVLEAKKALDFDLNLTFVAGVFLPSGSHYGVSLSWVPNP